MFTRSINTNNQEIEPRTKKEKSTTTYERLKQTVNLINQQQLKKDEILKEKQILRLIKLITKL